MTGSLAGQGGEGGETDGPLVGGAPGGVDFSIWPTFASDPSEPRDAEAVFAGVSVLSAGVTTLTLAERWDELSGPTGSPRALTWSRLDALVKPYRDRSGKVALCIDVVDRLDPAWPVSGALDSDAALAAMRRTIDEVYARYAAQLSHLCFGYEVDRYLAQATRVAGGRLRQLLGEAVAYASQHPDRGDDVRIGVALTLGALREPDRYSDWLLGDEAIGVYDPLEDETSLKPVGSGAEELEQALDALATGARSGLPLALWEVGYPSRAGSSEKAQRNYYEALLEVLEARRDRVSFVSMFGFEDRAPSDCDAEAAHFGSESGALRSEARCSMGLRADGEPKLAWPAALGAVARGR